MNILFSCLWPSFVHVASGYSKGRSAQKNIGLKFLYLTSCFLPVPNYIVCSPRVCGSRQAFQGGIDTDIFSNCRLLSTNVCHHCPVQWEHLMLVLEMRHASSSVCSGEMCVGAAFFIGTCSVKFEWKEPKKHPGSDTASLGSVCIY